MLPQFASHVERAIFDTDLNESVINIDAWTPRLFDNHDLTRRRDPGTHAVELAGVCVW